MLKYTLKRLASGVLLVFTVSFLVFALMYMMPGDPVDILAGPRVSDAKKAEIRASYGLDKPMPQQYLIWLNKIFHGDFGTSISTKQDIGSTLGQRIPLTLKLSGTALLFELLIGVPLGLLAAYKKDSIGDRILMWFSSILQAVPGFWLAMALVLFFSVTLKALPLNGFETPKHFVLPVTAMVLGGMTGLIRLTKSEVLEVNREKYVQTAYAKGLSDRQVAIRHVLRNSLITVVVLLLMDIPWLISGSIIIENVFVIPGMGNYLTNAIARQDFPVIQACVLIISVLTVVCNLLSDLLTAALDPRIRIEITEG